jgi:DNA-binding transcriptional ArsR family regulator
MSSIRAESKATTEAKAPRITWDQVTACDLFVSLHVLHHPGDFGLRPAWAAGMRARIPAVERAALEHAAELAECPLHFIPRWMLQLPEPKDAASALRALKEMPPEDRILPRWIREGPDDDDLGGETMREVFERAGWLPEHKEKLRECRLKVGVRATDELLERILETWAHPAAFGERYLAALRTYYEVFYQEEETRIRPALERAVEQGRQLAETRSFVDLVEELSRGVRLAQPPQVAEVIMVPSYWLTPIFYQDPLGKDQFLMVFGARPKDASLISGENVPDALVETLKAIADPTRLRILRYLTSETLTPAQLAQRLRLRAPTVIHHLRELRLAGLVQIRVDEEKDKRYAARLETIRSAFGDLDELLRSREGEEA